RHRRRDHLDRAARQPEVQRPDGTLAAPVVNLLKGRREDALLAQFGFELFVHPDVPWSQSPVEAFERANPNASHLLILSPEISSRRGRSSARPTPGLRPAEAQTPAWQCTRPWTGQ